MREIEGTEGLKNPFTTLCPIKCSHDFLEEEEI